VPDQIVDRLPVLGFCSSMTLFEIRYRRQGSSTPAFFSGIILFGIVR